MSKINQIIIIFLLITTSCKKKVPKADAYGNFEATSTIISAKSSGELVYFPIDEGQKIAAGQLVALVDTTQLHLQRKLLYSQLGIIPQKTTDPDPEIAVLKKQKANLLREHKRLKNLVEVKAATTKQLDDIEGQISVVNQQIDAARKKANTVNRGILSEKDPLLAQIALIDQKIKDSYIYNPVSGTVINKLSEPSEVVGFGSPLYSIANLQELTLRAYTDAIRIQNIKIGDEVAVLVDSGNDSMRTVKGIISWISDEAEFTPKIIQTKEERVNLVYALKIRVKNDGRLKIGMPAEVEFNASIDPSL